MLWKDFRFAGRALRRSPAFTLTAIATIALGTGASTAIFSVAHAVLLRPLPYKNADRLVLAWEDMHVRNVRDWLLSVPDYLDFRNGTNCFESLAAVRTGRATLPAADGTIEQIRTANITSNFFSQMGTPIFLGRDFNDADGTPQPVAQPGAPPPPPVPASVILSYEYWQRRYGGRKDAIGQNIGRAGTGTIVGVLAPGFELLLPPNTNQERLPDVWFAFRLRYDEATRNGAALIPIGTLKPGITLQQAQSQADRVADDLRRRLLIQRTAGTHIRLEPMRANLVAEARPALFALMGAVLFLLLIACSNVANLLLVRLSLRERELAVRAAIGGSRWRLVRQTLAEAFLLSGTGTLLGILLAKLGIHELRLIGPKSLPRLDSIAIDLNVLAFSAFAGLIAAAIFGIVPALRASRPNIADVLRSGGRNAGLGAGKWLRNAVIVAEVALSFVLLIGSGLMFRSFIALRRVDPGYEASNLLTFVVAQPNRGPVKPDARAAYVRDLKRVIAEVPGVQAVTAGSSLPLDGGISPIRWGTAQAQGDPGKFQATDFNVVLPGFFETMRVPVLAGRTFTEADNAPDRARVVIDQKLAAKAFPNQSAVGKRILTRIQTPEAVWVEVIGVVAHQRENTLTQEGREQIFFTDGYLNHGFVNRWAVRTAGDPSAYAGAVRAAIARKDSHLALFELQPMRVWVEKAQESTRFSLLLIGLFGAMAALLTAVGLYGVLSTVVRQRSAEIGLRMAVGAAPSRIFNLIVGHGLRLTVIGVTVGMVAALGLTRGIRSLLVDVKPTDPLTFAGMAVFFVAIAALASWLPARRAAGLAPVAALRDE